MYDEEERRRDPHHIRWVGAIPPQQQSCPTWLEVNGIVRTLELKPHCTVLEIVLTYTDIS
jgi:hypothetical protein